MRPPLAVPPPARAEEPSLSFSDPTADAVLRSADREAVEEAGGLCGVAFLYAWLASLCDDGGTGIDACCFGCCDGSGSELCGDCCGADCFCC